MGDVIPNTRFVTSTVRQRERLRRRFARRTTERNRNGVVIDTLPPPTWRR